MRKSVLKMKVRGQTLLQIHPISFKNINHIDKFCPKYEEPYLVIKIQNNNLVIENRHREMVSIDKVRICKMRKNSSIICESNPLYQYRQRWNLILKTHSLHLKLIRVGNHNVRNVRKKVKRQEPVIILNVCLRVRSDKV